MGHLDIDIEELAKRALWPSQDRILGATMWLFLWPDW